MGGGVMEGEAQKKARWRRDEGAHYLAFFGASPD